jgi:hypothetical protein
VDVAVAGESKVGVRVPGQQNERSTTRRGGRGQHAWQRAQGRQQRAVLQRAALQTGRLKNRKIRLENCLTCSGAKTPD